MQDILLAAVTTAASVASLILVTKWLAGGLGPTEFGFWGLSRRLFITVTSVSTIPLGVALARGLAMARDEGEMQATLLAGALIALVPNLLLLVLGLLAPDLWAVLVFRDPARGGLIVATAAGLGGMAVYTVVFGWYRGRQQMRRASFWQLWSLGLGPLLAAWSLRDSQLADPVVLAMGLTPLVAVLPLVGWVVKAPIPPWHRITARIRDLLRYAVPRIPGGLAFGVLLSIGPLLAGYAGTMADAGYLVVGQSALRVVEGATASFAVVALPKIASMNADGATDFLRDRSEDLIAMALHLGLFLSGLLLLWAPEIVAVWLGPGYELAVPVVRVFLMGVCPYLGYAVLRSVIDALEERAVNARNVYRAVGVTTALSLLAALTDMGTLGLAGAGVLGFCLLGALSVRHLWRSLHLGSAELRVAGVVGVNIGFLALFAVLRNQLPLHWTAGGRLVAGIVAGLLGGVAYVLLLRRRGVRWVSEIEERLMYRKLQ